MNRFLNKLHQITGEKNFTLGEIQDRYKELLCEDPVSLGERLVDEARQAKHLKVVDENGAIKVFGWVGSSTAVQSKKTKFKEPKAKKVKTSKTIPVTERLQMIRRIFPVRFVLSDLKPLRKKLNFRSDKYLSAFLSDCLSAGLLAVDPGVRVNRYYHWTPTSPKADVSYLASMLPSDSPIEKIKTRTYKHRRPKQYMSTSDRLVLLKEVFPDRFTSKQAIRKRKSIGCSSKDTVYAFLSMCAKEGLLLVEPGKQTFRLYYWPDSAVERTVEKLFARSEKKAGSKQPAFGVSQVADSVNEIDVRLNQVRAELHKALVQRDEIDAKIKKLASEENDLNSKLSKVMAILQQD